MAPLVTILDKLFGQFNPPRSRCYLTPYDPGTDVLRHAERRALQYFPESLTDNYETEYATKKVFGGSLPLYQWSNSGPRTISFTAVFTADVDLHSVPRMRPADVSAQLRQAGEDDRNVDLRSAVMWLRSYLLPTYGDTTTGGVPLTHAPRKVWVLLPKSGIGWYAGDTSGDPDGFTGIMTECNATWEAYFPSGYPRVATVTLSFAQVAQLGGSIRFPSYTERFRAAIYDPSAATATGSYLGYNVGKGR